MVIASNTTGMVVELNPSANPLIMLGAAPEWHDLANLYTGWYAFDV
jgi:hypothetical protein